jgi:uncharacterized lipoprotein YmbA
VPFVALLVSACGITGTSPEPRFYTLASETPPPATVSAAPYTVVVGPVTIPEVVDRPQVVTRTNENQVHIHEQERWAAPLKSQIARVIADRLAKELDADARVSTTEQRVTGAPDYRVIVDVQRFESSAAEVTIQTEWSVRRKDGRTAFSARSVDQAAAAAGVEGIVTAYSRALATLGSRIAGAIRDSKVIKPH